MHSRLQSLFALLLCAAGSAGSAAPPVRPASSVGTGLPPSATASGGSGAAQFAGSPSRILFLSDAPDLVVDDANGIASDLFLRDVAAGTTLLVATRPDGRGGNGPTVAYGVAADGSRVAFASAADDLVPGDLNRALDVFVRDLPSGPLRLVSAAPDGLPGNGDSSEPVVSSDGRWVLFESTATNLTPAADTNGVADVFLRDVASGTTEWVSVAPDGSPGSGASRTVLLAAAGDVVVFRSESTNLAPVAPGLVPTDLHVRRRQEGLTLRVALPGPAPAGTPATVHVQNVVADATGRHLAFCTELAAPIGLRGVWWFDLVQGTAVLASGGRWVDAVADDGSGPSMAADGRTLAFASRADRFATTTASVWDADAGLRTLEDLVVPPSPGAVEPANVVGPVLSPDGTRIAFVTDVAVPSAGVPEAGRSRLYVRTLATGATVAAPVGGDVASGDAAPEFSADGSWLVFRAGGRVDGIGDRNRAHDVLVAPVSMGSATLVSARRGPSPPATASGPSWTGAGALSDDGRWVAFTSMAGDLFEGDDGGLPGVFVRDLVGGGVRRAGITADGQASRAATGWPRISADGSRVAFVGEAALTPGDTNRLADVYVRDLASGTTLLVSARDGGDASAAVGAGYPAIGGDGLSVLFEGRSTDWTGATGTQGSLYRRDLAARRTARLLDLPAAGGQWAASRDLRWVAAWSVGATASLRLYSAASGSLVTVASGFTPGAVGFSADGARMAYVAALPDGTGRALQWRDNVAGTSRVILAVATNDVVRDLAISADGRRVVFTTTAPVPGVRDDNGLPDVLVHDIATGVTRLASRTADGSAGNGASGAASVDATGSHVVFRGPAGLQSYDVDTDMVTALAPGTSGVARPVVSPDGRWAVFMSGVPDLASGDLNGVTDVLFVATPEVAPAIRLEAGPSQVSGALRLRFTAEPGWSYRLERAPLLDPSRFVPAGDAITGTGGVQELTVPLDGEAGFLRVVARR